MLALGLAAGAAGGWFLWHLLRRPEAPRALSFARFLPELPPAERPRARLSFRPPLGSLPFWLRMAAAALVLAALLTRLDRPVAGGPGPGLRLVVDVSASMGVAEGAGTRLDAALAVGRDLAAGAACIEVVPVAAAPGPPQASLDLLPVPEGAGPAPLIAAALAPPGACPLSHVVVLTDQRRPPQAEGMLWRQVGAPAANAGIVAASETPGGLAGPGAVLAVEVATWPPGDPPALTLQGPGGGDLSLRPLPGRAGRWLAEAPHPGPGRFTLSLSPGGALAADDRMALELGPAAAPPVDWRLPLPMPPGLTADPGPGALLVAPLDDPATEAALNPATARPVLAVWPGWAGGGQPRRIGAFLEAPELTGALNLDAFEAAAPEPLPTLPSGFTAILTDTGGGIFLARRTAPPGLILPAPDPAAPGQAAPLSLTLFYQGLAALAGQGRRALPPDWRLPDGTPVPGAGAEGDTARPLDPPEPLDLTPRPPAGRAPLWPLLLVLALAALVAERGVLLWSLRRAV